jgi:hypothetical protein
LEKERRKMYLMVYSIIEIDKLCDLQDYNTSFQEDSNLNCRECDSKFKTLAELDEHMRKVHDLKVSNE